ncbi:MAG: SpoIID/LytB domain-containing protein [Desulfosudaceae bacterium]
MKRPGLTCSVYGILLLTTVFFLGAAIDGAKADNDFFFNKAAEFLASGKFLEAIGLYQAVADNSDSEREKARAMLMLGSTYHRYLDQPDTALRYFDFIMSRYSSTPYAGDAMYHKGMALYQDQQYEKAYETFVQYPALYPEARHIAAARTWAESARNLVSISASSRRSEKPDWTAVDTLIRVLIVENQNKVTVAAKAPVCLVDRTSSDRLQPGEEAANRLVLTADEEGLVVNGRPVKSAGPFLLRSLDLGVAVNDNRYRGFFSLWVTPGQKLCVVNHVDIEQYLYGVVPREMPWNWPRPALMAQAVAARTYALYVKQKSKDRRYDVKSTTASQVYGGLDAEQSGSSRAVDATRGQILTFDGHLIVAYYHANSGGYTECPENVWGARVPYLKARPDKYSLGTPGSQWRYFLPYQEADKQLREYGLAATDLKTMQLGETTSSGRIREVIVSSNNGRKKIAANNFRLAIGGTKLKSTCFKTNFRKRGILFEGTGYGHGVGMSQWGAREMALKGHDYRDILRHYYSGINLASLNRRNLN